MTHFAVCVLACNDRADCGSHGVLTARAYREFGIEGAKVAIVGVPAGKPGPGRQAAGRHRDAWSWSRDCRIRRMGGVWIKRAPRAVRFVPDGRRREPAKRR